MVHWDLLSRMTTADALLVIQEALERNGMATALVLHAGSGYMEPVVYDSGGTERRKSERAAKLRAAREERRRINAERLQLAA